MIRFDEICLKDLNIRAYERLPGGTETKILCNGKRIIFPESLCRITLGMNKYMCYLSDNLWDDLIDFQSCYGTIPGFWAYTEGMGINLEYTDEELCLKRLALTSIKSGTLSLPYDQMICTELIDIKEEIYKIFRMLYFTDMLPDIRFEILKIFISFF